MKMKKKSINRYENSKDRYENSKIDKSKKELKNVNKKAPRISVLYIYLIWITSKANCVFS